jgi:hypothetical protein
VLLIVAILCAAVCRVHGEIDIVARHEPGVFRKRGIAVCSQSY